MSTNQQTLQQRRAARAWSQVEAVEKRDNTFRKEYGSLMRGMPAMIQSDGLAPSLAFLNSKAGGDKTKPHHMVYEHLAEWLGEELQVQGDLLQWVIHRDSSIYRQTATEAQAYLHWLKRFVEAKGWKGDEE